MVNFGKLQVNIYRDKDVLNAEEQEEKQLKSS